MRKLFIIKMKKLKDGNVSGKEEINKVRISDLNHFYKLFQDENGLMEVVYIMKQLIHCFKYVLILYLINTF